MPNINDLKNDGKIKISTPKKQQPFIPTISQDNVESDNNNGEFIPTIEVGDNSVSEQPMKRKGSVMSMTTAKAREKADFSDLPEPETTVDMRESLEQDILGPGGVFDEYLDNMKAEAKEFFANEELEESIKSEESEEVDEEKEELSEDDLDTEEIEKEYNSDASVRYKNIDIFETSTEDDMEDNIKEEESFEEEDLDEKISEESENSNVTTVDYSVETNEPEEEIEIKREIVKNEVSEENVDDELDEDVETSDDDITEDDANKYLEIIKSEVTKRIKPVSKKLDISSFTVVKKPTMNNAILEPREVPVAKWALPATGITFQIKEIFGSSIEKIRTAISNNQMNTVLQIIYDHIVSPKPATMEAWAKTIAFDDFDHLFMGVYIASFADSNFIQMVCDNNECKDKVFVTDNIPIMNMVKFKDDKAEKEFKALLNSDAVNPKGLYVSEIIPISEKFAFGFTVPSIYSIYIEERYLDETFRTKYANAASIAPYVDNIYYIDQENSQLTPIGYKDYPNNKAKTIKSKIVKFDKIISTLDMDEINLIRAYMAKIIESSNTLSYVVPEATCPHCGKVIAETPTNASQAVFQRNQLSLLVNI